MAHLHATAPLGAEAETGSVVSGLMLAPKAIVWRVVQDVAGMLQTCDAGTGPADVAARRDAALRKLASPDWRAHLAATPLVHNAEGGVATPGLRVFDTKGRSYARAVGARVAVTYLLANGEADAADGCAREVNMGTVVETSPFVGFLVAFDADKAQWWVTHEDEWEWAD